MTETRNSPRIGKLRITFDPHPNDRIILFVISSDELAKLCRTDTFFMDDISDLLPMQPRKVAVAYAAVPDPLVIAEHLRKWPKAKYEEVIRLIEELREGSAL